MTHVMPTAAAPRDHFSRLVAQWSHFGPPLRPSLDDTVAMQRAADGLCADAQVAVLGLTPEIIGCDWPRDVRLFAVDHSPKMIAALWPPARGPAHAQAILADWCTMPIAPGTIDLVCGDGCYVLLPYPDGYDDLTRAVRGVLRPDGRFAIRVFLRPDQPESVVDIARALAAGEIGSVHALKLRLLAAVHGASGAGSRLDDAWRAWESMPALPVVLAGRRGWTADEIAGVESYRAMQARYYLPTLAEFRQHVGAFLDEIECTFGSHELGERCPTLVFARRAE